jgi:hypothetical protein
VNKAARANGLDPFWLAAILKVENAFKPKGDSPAGAVGIAQIELAAHPNVTRAEAEDPSFAIPWAARYLAELKRRAGGSTTRATEFYNTGPGASPATLRSAGTAYLDQVTAAYRELRKTAGAGVAALLAGGFLRPGSTYKPGRSDQGRDFQTNPGGAIVAPGDGTVLAVKSDPAGFGPSYPVVKFSTGPYAGEPPVYLGHTLAALKAGASFKAGQVLAHTGTTPIGNASKPGWAEIGYAPGGNPGRYGQPAPFAGAGGAQLVSSTGQPISFDWGGFFDPRKLLPGAGGATDAVIGPFKGLEAVGAAFADLVNDPTKVVMWLAFMLVGFAFLYLGVTRLFGVRPHLPSAVPVPV